MNGSTRSRLCWIGAAPGEAAAGALLAAKLDARRVDAAGAKDLLSRDGARLHLAAGADHARALEIALEHSARVETLALLSPPPLETLDPALVARLKTLETPTLLLFGALSSHDPRAPGTAWRRAFGKAHLVYVFDAAEPIDAARPEAVAEAMADFIARKDGFLVRVADDRMFP